MREVGEMVKRLREITPSDLEIIERYHVQCEDYFDGKKVCQTCNVRHSRLPHPPVFRAIVGAVENLYTHTAYANIWGVGREATRELFVRAFPDAPPSAEIQYGSNPKQQTEELLVLVKDNPHISGNKALIKKAGITENHLKYLRRNVEFFDELLTEQYDRNRSIPKESYTCYRCHLTMPREDFHNSKRTRDGVSRTCKVCSKNQQKSYYYKRYEENINGDIFTETKRCPVCQLTLSADNFHRARGNRDGLQAQCKECHYDYVKAYIQKKKIKEEQGL